MRIPVAPVAHGAPHRPVARAAVVVPRGPEVCGVWWGARTDDQVGHRDVGARATGAGLQRRRARRLRSRVRARAGGVAGAGIGAAGDVPIHNLRRRHGAEGRTRPRREARVCRPYLGAADCRAAVATWTRSRTGATTGVRARPRRRLVAIGDTHAAADGARRSRAPWSWSRARCRWRDRRNASWVRRLAGARCANPAGLRCGARGVGGTRAIAGNRGIGGRRRRVGRTRRSWRIGRARGARRRRRLWRRARARRRLPVGLGPRVGVDARTRRGWHRLRARRGSNARARGGWRHARARRRGRASARARRRGRGRGTRRRPGVRALGSELCTQQAGEQEGRDRGQ